jgi:hypothetical protein
VAEGAPRRISLHSANAPGGRLGLEAWIDDDLGQPVNGATVELRGPLPKRRAETDRFGVARFELPRPTASCRFTAEAAALPGLEAAIDLVAEEGRLHAVSSLVGEGAIEAREPPTPTDADFDLPIRPAAPVELRLEAAFESFDARAPRPITVRVTIRALAGTHPDLEPTATGGRVVLTRAGPDTAELRYLPPVGAPVGARFFVAVTDRRSGITAYTEVVAR